MKDKNLLDMMSNIEDSFIEEAAHPEILLKMKHRRRFISVSKIGTLAACMVIAVGMIVAVPYMRVSKEDAMHFDQMNSAIQSAIDATNKAQDDGADALASSIAADKNAQEALDASIASSIAADKAAMEAALKHAQEEAAAAAKAAEAASKASKEAADKAKAEAEKAAKEAEAAKSEAESMKECQEATLVASVMASVFETTKSTTETALSQFVDEHSGIIFTWRDHVLYGVAINADHKPFDLVIPETLAGEPIIEISDTFWDFYTSHQELKTITIPDTIEKFGNVSVLEKSVTIICSADSPAAEFFTQAGYSVQILS